MAYGIESKLEPRREVVCGYVRLDSTGRSPYGGETATRRTYLVRPHADDVPCGTVTRSATIAKNKELDSGDHTIFFTQVAERMHKGSGRRTVDVCSIETSQGGHWGTRKSRERVPIEGVEDMVQRIRD
jgi:hypothetical protein